MRLAFHRWGHNWRLLERRWPLARAICATRLCLGLPVWADGYFARRRMGR